MSEADFLDTNVLSYLLSAEALFGMGSTISVQVLNEFASVASRKLALTWEEIADFSAGMRALCHVRALSLETHALGLYLAPRYQFSLYDAMIVAKCLVGRLHDPVFGGLSRRPEGGRVFDHTQPFF